MVVNAIAGERLPIYGDGANVRRWNRRPPGEDFQASKAQSRSVCVPTTLLRTNAPDDTIERST